MGSATSGSPSARAAGVAMAFRQRFARMPRVYRAPGRINLIGEHTDYNQGWVMPAAIDLAAWIAIAPRPDRRLCLHSEQFARSAEFELGAMTGAATPELPTWARSLRGVAMLLAEAGTLINGADVWIDSDVPVGAGLSSSAAVEVGLAWALTAESGARVDPTGVALLCQRASHEYAGVRCGIMDFYISAHGRAGEFLELDTRALAGHWHRWSPETCLFVADTGVHHDHAAGEYNRRRAECEAAVEIVGRTRPGVTSLRDVDGGELDRHAEELGPVLLARSRHVVGENARVAAAAQALDRGDFITLGRLLDASHASLRDDYQVSCAELDLLAELCRRQPGVYGARMMGGGFGGCVLALVAPANLARVRETVGREYTTASGRRFRCWDCVPAAGAGPAALT